MLVAAGFMPALKNHQKIPLAVLERGLKARGYEFPETAVFCRGGYRHAIEFDTPKHVCYVRANFRFNWSSDRSGAAVCGNQFVR